MDERTSEAGERLSTARRLHPGEVGQPSLDRLSALARRLLDCASSAVTLVTDVASPVGSSGVPAHLNHDLPLTDSLCARTAALGRPLVVNDTQTDERSAVVPLVVAGHAGSFLGVPIRADNDVVVGAMCVFDPRSRLWNQEDVTTLAALAESAAAELELAALARDYSASRARWDLAIASADVGSFDWDLRTGTLSWDETLIEMFGYGDDDVFEQTIEAFNSRVHPDDVAAVTQRLQRAIDTSGEFEAEYRIVLPGGTVRQIQARGRAIGEGSVADRLLGAAWDVTATRAIEDRAARIVEAMPVAYLHIDSRDVVTAANHLAEQLLLVNRLDLLGKVLWQVVPEASGARLDELCLRARASRSTETEDLRFDEPVSAWLEVRVAPVRDGIAMFFTDATRRRLAREDAERAAAHDRDTAEALQRALLTQLPQPDHLEIRARYVTADSGDLVGGDWFDAVVQPEGSTAVVVGDVVGHDIDAAATMGQLRSILRLLLWQSDQAPATAIAELDRAMQELYPGALATLVAARLEQNEQMRELGAHILRFSNAGHLPPMIVPPAGEVTVAYSPPEVMLGVVADVERHDHAVELPSGTTVVFYTDGLVERRGEDLELGIERLRAALQDHARLPVPQLLDAVLAELVGERGAQDDVVLLALRVHPSG